MTEHTAATATDTHLSPLGRSDLEAVIAIDQASSGQARRTFFERRLDAALERPHDYVYVGLHAAGHLCGFAMARLIDGDFGQPGARAALDAIGVSREVQNHGAGHDLLNRVKEILVHKGTSALETQVDWSDRALLGFLGNAGFDLAPRMVLCRTTEAFSPTVNADLNDAGDPAETDYSDPSGDEAHALARDRELLRAMKPEDLAAVKRIDRALSGQDRGSYFAHIQRQIEVGAGVRLSLVAERDGFVVGYIMARVDYGEFGRTVPVAVMDALGIDPGFQGQGIGRALMDQLISNLAILQVERLRTEVAWNDTPLIAFFSLSGFAPSQSIALSCPL